jgi:DNA polymerase-3 subunit gamma/tau
MGHVALYREWRPSTFDEVVEQQHVVIALRQAVMTSQISHAYLFSGTRGTGKTTLAKIFSRAINCLNPQNGNPCNQCSICKDILNGSMLDVVEMDAASNNSVDTIRRICDEVVFMPTQAHFKVYIIDEVHMLSTGAFNALLKTLEEPPAHAVFILATTEPYRIPATILSRCQRYDFRRIPLPSLIGRLREIAIKDQISVDDAALDMMARLAEGGMRDAISLLDQIRMIVPEDRLIGRDDVLRMTGVADDDLLEKVSRAIFTADATSILMAIDQLIMAGRDPARFLIDLAAFCRNLLVILVTPDPLSLLQITQEQHQRLVSISRLADSITLVTVIRNLSALNGELRWSTDSRTTLEIGLLRMMSENGLLSVKPFAAEKASIPTVSQVPAISVMPETPVAAVPLVPSESPVVADMPAAPAARPDTMDDEDGVRWQAIQNQLLADGQMTLYLFSRPAAISFCGGELHLLFPEKDRVNYQELNEPQSIKLLRSAATRVMGTDTSVIVRIANDPLTESRHCPVPDEPMWITRVRDVAGELGIPIKMEE